MHYSRYKQAGYEYYMMQFELFYMDVRASVLYNSDTGFFSGKGQKSLLNQQLCEYSQNLGPGIL